MAFRPREHRATSRTILAASALALTLAACASAPTQKASADPVYQSRYANEDEVVAGYDLGGLTPSKMRKLTAVGFDRPAADVFYPLLTRVDLYDDTVVTVTFDHSRSEHPGSFGVGSVRICTFTSGKTLYEPLVAFEEGRVYAYTVDEERSTRGMPVDDVLLFYTFEDTAPGKSLVTVRAHFSPKPRIATPMIEYAFGRSIDGAFARAAEVFGGRLVDADG